MGNDNADADAVTQTNFKRGAMCRAAGGLGEGGRRGASGEEERGVFGVGGYW
ncbi:UNVERIFIED_CONTAM: hypothetical protein Slati_4463800 [Sesamum latifolium]|uniref:Uncharacterized protein n=1 Tax=Sesamum latifolium TaxID=2727402 RepID=A0AAW2STU6_9LAMI